MHWGKYSPRTMVFACDFTKISAFLPRGEQKEAKMVCPTRLGNSAEKWTEDPLESTL